MEGKVDKQKQKIRETDLYQPIYQYLVEKGYRVRSEVNHCDLTAIKEGELIIIELKLQLSLELLLQAVQRQKLTDSVYVAVPRPKQGFRTRRWKELNHLLKRLELGLITVSVDSEYPLVEILFHPLPYQGRKQKQRSRALITEIKARSLELNQGGSFQKKIVTAYRETAIHIACCLHRYGPLTPKKLRELGTGEKTSSILAQNYYNWFERIERGVYRLKASALAELEAYQPLMEYYLKRLPR